MIAGKLKLLGVLVGIGFPSSRNRRLRIQELQRCQGYVRLHNCDKHGREASWKLRAEAQLRPVAVA